MADFPLSTKFRCKCDRDVCTTDGFIYTSLGDRNGVRYPYVYLRRHNSTPGVRCAEFAARTIRPATTEKES